MNDLPEMVSVMCGPNGVRISKVTPHGEEVIVPDVLAAAMGVMLWARVTEKELVGWNAFDLSPDAAKAVLRQAIGAPIAVLEAREDALLRDYATTLARLQWLEQSVADLQKATFLAAPPRPMPQ